MPPEQDDAPRRPRAIALLSALGFLALLAVALAGAAGRLRTFHPPPQLAVAPAGAGRAPLDSASGGSGPGAGVRVAERFSAVTVRLNRNQTLAQALVKLDLPMAQVNAVVGALKGLFPFHRSRPGDQLRIERRDGEADLHRLSYRQGPADEWVVQRVEDGTLRGLKRPVALTTTVERVAMKIEGSLWASMERAGEDPELAVLAAEVLAWDVDFYQDVRAGDAMRVVVEKVFADGQLLRYGEVLAAEYDGASTGRKRLFRYTDPDGQTSYYDDNGNSARRGFLKSPLKYARITSRFGYRNHPLLGYQRAHQGVDYGAPTGTPVWAVGDGAVRQAGWNGGCGKSVTLRHRNGLETVYCHLSAVAVSAGKGVAQKQVIGYVGSTGLSTGPHLHYAVRRGGAFLNPLQLKIPRDAPVQARFLPDFREKLGPVRARLEGEPVALN